MITKIKQLFEKRIAICKLIVYYGNVSKNVEVIYENRIF